MVGRFYAKRFSRGADYYWRGSPAVFQAEIHLQQDKACVLDDFADHFKESFDIAIEELHDHLVTFVIELADYTPEHESFFRASDQVEHVERLDANNVLVTKTSCGAYSAVDRNHGILRRRNFISRHRRVYTVLFFRREDLRAMIADFKQIGTVTLDKLKEFQQSANELTNRQEEVVQRALDEGYFEWPREVTSDELAAKMDISRATLLEHLRKGEAKLLSDALDDGDGSDDSQTAQRH